MLSGEDGIIRTLKMQSVQGDDLFTGRFGRRKEIQDQISQGIVASRFSEERP